MALPMKKHGFAYEKGSNRWLFTRKMNGHFEYIEIDKSNTKKKTIRAVLYNGFAEKDAKFLFDGDKFGEWFYYQDESSLCEVLKTLLLIIENQGLNWFALNIPPGKPVPDNFLSEEIKSKAIQFMNSNSLETTDMNALINVERILLQNSDGEIILFCSYFLGEYLIKHVGGKWDYDENGVPYIKDIGGLDDFSKSPYEEVIAFIDDPGYSLKDMLEILNEILEE
ncbi:hypothetical protein ACK8P5_12565 [Paenibacillus sp. EC2-1]|uniref:hypothetical protein n=1 Tax=Paenibacillus sp. EC2-1 TaxID=3388665 RepID=UPI003BEECFAB